MDLIRARTCWLMLLAGFVTLGFRGHRGWEAIAADEPKPIRVFYTGHSFSGGPFEWMAILAKQGGISGYEALGRQVLGGSRVISHWDLAEPRNQAKAALRKGNVDVLVLSPNMQMPDEGIDRFVHLAMEHNPEIRVLVQGSWMTWDGLGKGGITNALRDERPVSEVRERTIRHMGEIRDQLRQINQRVGRNVCRLVPVGLGVVRLREMIAEGSLPGFQKPSQLFSDDIGHAHPAVSHLTTYMFYAALFSRDPQELAGLGNNGWTQKWGQPPKELAGILKRVAWETMRNEPLSGLEKAK